MLVQIAKARGHTVVGVVSSVAACELSVRVLPTNGILNQLTPRSIPRRWAARKRSRTAEVLALTWSLIRVGNPCGTQLADTAPRIENLEVTMQYLMPMEWQHYATATILRFLVGPSWCMAFTQCCLGRAGSWVSSNGSVVVSCIRLAFLYCVARGVNILCLHVFAFWF